MLELLHSKNLWREIAKIRGDKPVIAAIAYANKDQLKLRAKDILICDASDSRISTGATTYDLLSLLAKRKVDLWHLEKLHAKIARLSEYVVVGSANMTINSESLFEAVLLTDHADAVRQVDDLLLGLLTSNKLKRIDQTFLDRIKKIPVIKTGGGGKSNPKILLDQKPTSWVMGYRDLSPREQEKSDLIVAARSGTGDAPAYFRNNLKVAQKRVPVQIGDRLILVHIANKRVLRPVTVTGIFASGIYLFYTYEYAKPGEIAWKSVQTKLKEAGLYNRQGIPAQLPLDLEGAAIVAGLFRQRKNSG